MRQPGKQINRTLWAIPVITMAALTTIALVVHWIDPYALRCSDQSELLASPHQERAFHAHRIACVRPSVLVLGTSRVREGMRVSDWRSDAYNAGISAASTYELRRMAEHAMATSDIRQVIVMIDLISNVNPSQHLPTFSNLRLASLDEPTWLAPVRLLLDRLRLALSFPGLRAAVKKIYSQLQRQPFGVSYNPQGDLLEQAASKTEDPIRRTSAGMVREACRFKTERWPRITDKDAAEQAAILRANIQEFRRILLAAEREQARVTLAFNPTHAWHWHGMHLAGLDALFSDLKAGLLEVAGQFDTTRVDIHDFTAFNGPSGESVPYDPAGRMQHWIDSGHYTPALGARILQALSGKGDDLPHTRLGGRTIEDFGLRFNEAHAQWMAAQPRQLALFDQSVTCGQ